jgi:hypothetical protein
MTAGITNFLEYSRSKFPSEKLTDVDAQLEWNVGLGYQFATPKMYYRITGYCISLPDPHGWFPKYMPWAGLTVGYKF